MKTVLWKSIVAAVGMIFVTATSVVIADYSQGFGARHRQQYGAPAVDVINAAKTAVAYQINAERSPLHSRIKIRHHPASI